MNADDGWHIGTMEVNEVWCSTLALCGYHVTINNNTVLVWLEIFIWIIYNVFHLTCFLVHPIFARDLMTSTIFNTLAWISSQEKLCVE